MGSESAIDACVGVLRAGRGSGLGGSCAPGLGSTLKLYGVALQTKKIVLNQGDQW